MACRKLQSNYDIVIAGAGVSGLYCAYKLGKKSSICILEKLDRIGGLLKSDLVTIHDKTIKQEEGGMRFYKNRETYRLALKLGLKDKIVEFKMGGANNLNYIRGCRFTNMQAKDSKVWFDLYNTGLSEEEKEKFSDPYAILTDVFNTIRLQNGKRQPVTAQDWQKVRLTWKVNNIELYKWDFESLLRYMGLSYEAMKMIQYSVGFKSLFNRNSNAGFGFQSNLDFTSDPKFYTLKNGYDILPERLREESVKNGAKVHTLCELVKLDTEESNESFPIRIEYTDRNNAGAPQQTTIKCKRCILALPKIALQALASNNQWMKDRMDFSPYIESVISESLTKINLYFDNEWWSKFGIDSGPNFTDLKLGTVYVFHPIKDSTDLNNPGSLTIYCDYDNSYYWDSMQSIGNSYPPKEHVTPPPNSVLATKQVVASAMDQLTLLFQKPNFTNGLPIDEVPIEPIPDPVLATYTHWTEPRFGDSVHAWKVFSDDSKISPGMFDVLGPNISIIGESYSIVQEWVDGALIHTDSYFEYLNKSSSK